MDTIGIIFAMNEELTALKKYFTIAKITKIYDLTFYEVDFIETRLVLVESGVGKVNAGRTTQILIDNYKPRAIYNIGVAGGVDKSLKVGDVVISTSLVQHDFDATALGYAKGYMCTGIEPNKPTLFYSDKNLINDFEVTMKTLNSTDITVHKGVIATGDTFVSSSEKKRELLELFNATAVEMEGGAIAQTANKNGVPCMIIRAISDLADGSAPMSLAQVETKMAVFAASTIEMLLR